MQPIAGLLYNGKQCYVDDGAAPQEPPTDPVPPTAVVTSYPIAKLLPRNTEPSPWDSDPTRADRMFLWKMQTAYASALRSKPGAKQLFEDILVDNRGRTIHELYGPNYTETAASKAMQNQINVCKNDVGSTYSAATQRFNVAAYNGPLLGIYTALVAKKLAA